jgi:hypothetical protein
MKMEQIECSETSAYKIQTPGNHPEENIQHTEHGESLKSTSGFFSFLRINWSENVPCCTKTKDFNDKSSSLARGSKRTDKFIDQDTATPSVTLLS